ncbi:MAG: hydrogenase maturation protease [Deltaproteobacteria bacterium]|nr:hydrogenase maturation protease [Deltaproteobacteria bacterium]
MRAEERQPILVIGIGNEYRSDDAVGLMVARCLRERAPGRIEILEEHGEGTSLMEAWSNANMVFLIDAVHSNGPPGTLYRWDARAASLPAAYFHFSTHAVGLPAALELARVLNRLPHRIVVYGIEGKCFAAGVGLSPEVSAAVQETADSLCTEIRSCVDSRA